MKIDFYSASKLINKKLNKNHKIAYFQQLNKNLNIGTT